MTGQNSQVAAPPHPGPGETILDHLKTMSDWCISVVEIIRIQRIEIERLQNECDRLSEYQFRYEGLQ